MNEIILQLKGVIKNYPGVQALKNVDFALKKGEIHCLVGENGAGKSTLMKIIAGAETMDSGLILFEGKKAAIQSTGGSIDLGINIIYQEFNLIPHLNVAENIFLGKEPLSNALGFVDRNKMNHEAEEIIRSLGMDIPVNKKIYQLSVAEKQMVEICKAVSTSSKVLIMDEPSAALTVNELDRLFELIKKLKNDGVSIIYISHRLEEIFTIGDRVTVLRDGEIITTEKLSDLDKNEIVRLMVGRELSEEYPERIVRPGQTVLEVKRLSVKGILHDINFSLNKGEILGISGLVGSGRTELARAIFGDIKTETGSILLNGTDISDFSLRKRIEKGLGFVTEDRKLLGLMLDKPISENMSLAALDKFVKKGFITREHESAAVREYAGYLRLQYSSPGQKVKTLSGGNQQKVVLAKWLLTQSTVLIFDEPTRGIDVGAKKEIYDLMNSLAQEGRAVIMISSELPEILGMCDRIFVMREGMISRELSGDGATQEMIMSHAT